MSRTKKHRWMTLLLVTTSWLAGSLAQADVVTDWNITAGEIAVAARLPPPPTYRIMALVQSAVYEAVNAITKRYPPDRVQLDAAPGASIDAAVAEANRATLVQLVPAQQPAIDKAYQAALAAIPAGPAKTAGLAVGEKAAAAILAWGAEDGAATGETYRPHTTAGVYVPTVIPVVSQWPQRKPWLMTSPAQFRPGPPPALTSEVWARDYNEIKAIGGKNSTRRTAEQTAIARFWEATMPPIYHGVVRSVATMAGREVTQNARLFAAVTQAIRRRVDRRHGRQIPLPLLAASDGDPQRGHRRQRRDRTGAVVDAVHRHPHAPRVSLRALHRLRRRRHGIASRDRYESHADLDDDQCHRPRRGAELVDDRRLHAGGSPGAHLRRGALP